MWQRLAVLLFLLLSFSLAQAATTPTADFTDNGDGTVTHKTTGLTWKRCAEGMTWTGSTCSGTAQKFTWTQAKARGTNGWGLPTLDQLKSIKDDSRYNPVINTTIFPNTPSDFFWSAPVSGDGWWDAVSLDFYIGSVERSGYDDIADTLVRLVRGGRSTGASTTTSKIPVTPTSLQVFVNVPKPAFATGDPIKPSVTADYVPDTSKLYDVAMAIVMPTGEVAYDNGAQFVSTPSWMVRQVNLPASFGWIDRMNFTVNQGAPAGTYMIYLMLVNNGSVAAWDSVAFEYTGCASGAACGTGRAADNSAGGSRLTRTMPVADNTVAANPVPRAGNSFQNWDTLHYYLYLVEKYGLIKKVGEVKGMVEQAQDVSALVSALDGDQSLGEYADRMAAMRLMFFMLDHCNVAGLNCLLGSADLGKYFVAGFQKLLEAKIAGNRLWVSNFGASSITLSWRDNQFCMFNSWCMGNTSAVDLYITPLETCSYDGDEWNGSNCLANRESSRANTLASPQTYRKLFQSNVTGNTAKKSCANVLDTGCVTGDYGGNWERGLYLIEAVDSATKQTVSYSTIVIGDRIDGVYPIKRTVK